MTTLLNQLETQGINPEMLDELVHAAASETAIDVNNSGLSD